MIARVLTLVLGLALAWTSAWEPKGSEVYWHDLVLGLVIAAVSVVAVAVRGANYVLTALAVWLFLSGMVFPVVPHIYIGLVTGTLVFIFSMVSSSDRTFWPFGRTEAAKA